VKKLFLIVAFLLLAAPAWAAHTVTLSCTLPADWVAGSSGINFFRGTSAGAETTTPINSTPVTSCAFTDPNVVAGQTYYYTAVQVVSGLTSAKSNETNATVLPYAPSGLTATAN
jgi:hypothetical protein